MNKVVIKVYKDNKSLCEKEVFDNSMTDREIYDYVDNQTYYYGFDTIKVFRYENNKLIQKIEIKK